MNIKIDVEQRENNIEASVQGEIDAYTTPKLREQLLPLAEQKFVHMTIDLSGVEYMDSTGLGVFVGLFKTVRGNEGEFRLVGLSDRLTRLFDITGLADIINISSDAKGGMR